MEESGYRLVGTRFLHFYRFKKCKPKKVKYLCVYQNTNEPLNRSLYFSEGIRILTEYSGNQIVCDRFEHIFRITRNDINYDEFYKARIDYLKWNSLMKFLYSLPLALLGLLGIIFTIEGALHTQDSVFDYVIKFLFCTAIAMLPIMNIYNLFGYCYLKIFCKNSK